MSGKRTTYKDAGVDVEAGNQFVKNIAPMVKATFRPEVLNDLGGFGALFSLRKDKYDSPVLVSSTDGVGTKLKIAFQMDKHDTIGIDLVAMVVNDIVVQGAEPLFFLDYMAMGTLDNDQATAIVAGIARGCQEAGCSLVGGETAEMPGFYPPGDYELVGFGVGIVEKEQVIDGSSVTVGDCIIGLAASGLHSNGYSLARKVLLGEDEQAIHSVVEELGCTLGEELLRPTRIYVKTLLNLIRDFSVKGMAHITGGGLRDNIVRILPQRCQAIVRTTSWERPPIFSLISRTGGVDDKEMLATFNCGIGMAVIVPPGEVEEVISRAEALGETCYLIGEIGKREADQPGIVFIDDRRSSGS
ncbi:MAG: phosphoribosylformylglycinamidine cyclo-ligase [Deltaproteobacteria bacterium]|nr:phosphoribosylformylglycinamidine cyclo-ligase [Candidatus Anaeroferrophillus wilburensis]MBN2890147.1 phosphoribosylformylglycinamidine cyclo-ligase [Deltaproteobacteria bacterium]